MALGRIVRQPELAATLEAIAVQGCHHLYGGDLGEAIVAHLRRLGGCLTLDDIRAVKPVWKQPLAGRYRDLSINTLPPPSEAFQFLLTLRILDGFDFSSSERNGVEHLDMLWRAIRLAARERIANNNPAPDQLDQILSEQNAARLRLRLKMAQPLLDRPSNGCRRPPAGSTTPPRSRLATVKATSCASPRASEAHSARAWLCREPGSALTTSCIGPTSIR